MISTGRKVGWIVVLLTVLLAFMVIALACGEEEPAPAPTETETETAEPTATATQPGDIDGAQIYADNCQTCHGENGEGGVGADLRPLTEADVDTMIETITNGRGGMPAWGDRLSEEEIRAVAEHEILFE